MNGDNITDRSEDLWGKAVRP